jgi:hypothetical protein
MQVQEWAFKNDNNLDHERLPWDLKAIQQSLSKLETI